MINRQKYGVLSFCIVLAGFLLITNAVHAVELSPKSTVLKDYVKENDANFQFEVIDSKQRLTHDTYVLRMTSQQWRSQQEVSQPIWSHRISIVVPRKLKSDIGLLLIGGGSQEQIATASDDNVDTVLSLMAVTTGTIASSVEQIPNQPLIFSDDADSGRQRKEDEIVAYSFDKALTTADQNWPVYLPMVKGTVKAMDAIQAFVTSIIPNAENDKKPLNQFVITGFSKRGATAWLTSAVDPRVIAIAPGVFNVLNFTQALENHRASYGVFSQALKDYLAFDILDQLGVQPEGVRLTSIVDPYAYLDQIRIPKLIINASGDEFFPAGSALFYADKLQGETLFKTLPNTDHSGSNEGITNAFLGILNWYQSLIKNKPRPQISWDSNSEPGFLISQTNQRPEKVTLWQATNANGRDFRLETIGQAWQSSTLSEIQSDASIQSYRYKATLKIPSTGWSAYFIDYTFKGEAGLPQTYSTPIFIVPETKPFTLEQPVGNPGNAFFWQLSALLSQYNGFLLTAAQLKEPLLQQWLPLSIFDRKVETLTQLRQALSAIQTPQQIAFRSCLATRLNIVNQDLGWYSTVPLEPAAELEIFNANKPRAPLFLWQLWNQAYQAYQSGFYEQAQAACRLLNSQTAVNADL